ncbi:hypothetical protein L21TH_2346 [Caldisalinibacter kiritimatiensis]|uniref:Uncharacterized protein n=1 Tax=Caldisalinibacter kiritimatiensis TaxID=1304284 RepID=R1ASJ7_9FIRM|nr:hypothetical protein L21TH_2346 [Caldisalinibacter kiritimatiensis]
MNFPIAALNIITIPTTAKIGLISGINIASLKPPHYIIKKTCK